jgi:hypothetical protein
MMNAPIPLNTRATDKPITIATNAVTYSKTLIALHPRPELPKGYLINGGAPMSDMGTSLSDLPAGQFRLIW